MLHVKTFEWFGSDWTCDWFSNFTELLFNNSYWYVTAIVIEFRKQNHASRRTQKYRITAISKRFSRNTAAPIRKYRIPQGLRIPQSRNIFSKIPQYRTKKWSIPQSRKPLGPPREKIGEPVEKSSWHGRKQHIKQTQFTDDLKLEPRPKTFTAYLRNQFQSIPESQNTVLAEE